MAGAARRNSPNSQRGLVLYLSLLAAAGACLSVVGPIVGRPEVAIIALPLAALLATIAWMLSPRGLSNYRPGKLAAAQDRLFDTRLMRRLAPPPRQQDGE